MRPLTTRSRPVTARICASTAWRRASRSRNQDVAIRLITAAPRKAAIGIPRRFIPWAIVNNISRSGSDRWVVALDKGGRRTGRTPVYRGSANIVAQVGKVGSDGPGRAHANRRNLVGFLDAFKAVRGPGASLPAQQPRH